MALPGVSGQGFDSENRRMEMDNRSLKLKRGVVAVLTVLGLLGAYGLGSMQPWQAAHAEPAVSAPVAAPALPLPTGLPDMSAIVARNAPAVVNISVAGKVRRTADMPEFPGLEPGDPFYDFFRRFQGVQPHGEQRVRGQGSGFILREDGVILTNAHVVDGADEVTVKLSDKREFRAKVVGADKATDVAVLKVEARGLPVVKVGDSARSRVGEWVLAIGSPFGFESSATAGIISALSRALPDENYVPFIQTDVAVNPGNSGGPLFNMAGEVIGINSQIYSRSGGYQGLSFAIPIEVAMKVERQITKTGQVQRGRLGVSIQSLDQSLADSFGLSRPAGALVSEIEAGGPAAKAGLEPGDVILAVNGQTVESSSALPPLVADLAPGATATLKVWRKGGEREIKVQVGRQPSAKAAAGESTPAVGGRLGLAVRPVDLGDGMRGLRVEQATGAAAKAGIQPGDVLLSVNGEPVGNVETLRTLIGKAGKRVALLVQRGETRLFVPVDLG